MEAGPEASSMADHRCAESNFPFLPRHAFGNVVCEAQRERDSGECRIRASRCWKYATGSNEKVAEALDLAVIVDNALRRINSHSRRADLMVAIGGLCSDGEAVIGGVAKVFEMSVAPTPDFPIEQFMRPHDGLDIATGILEIHNPLGRPFIAPGSPRYTQLS